MMTTWPKDNTAAKNAFYGDFHQKGWASIYLTRIKPAFTMYYDKHPLASGILVNKNCASAMLAAFAEIWDQCGHDQTAVDKTGASDYGGCFNIRPIAGSNNWSNHSWACAIDLSPATNGFNMKGTLSSIVVDAFKRQGARWGGDYHGRTDPMHFEFVST
ncbi:MAG TPA: M15 family metallopeptidase [Candidatus Paceibacterota bacterium]